MNRRKFLVSACAVAIAPALPPIPLMGSWGCVVRAPATLGQILISDCIGELKVGQLVNAPGIPRGMRITALISNSVAIVDYGVENNG